MSIDDLASNFKLAIAGFFVGRRQFDDRCRAVSHPKMLIS